MAPCACACSARIITFLICACALAAAEPAWDDGWLRYDPLVGALSAAHVAEHAGSLASASRLLLLSASKDYCPGQNTYVPLPDVPSLFLAARRQAE